MTKEQHRERHAWQELITLLKSSGAITEEDCKRSQESNWALTSGDKLFAAIRKWEIARIKLYETQRIEKEL